VYDGVLPPPPPSEPDRTPFVRRAGRDGKGTAAKRKAAVRESSPSPPSAIHSSRPRGLAGRCSLSAGSARTASERGMILPLDGIGPANKRPSRRGVVFGMEVLEPRGCPSRSVARRKKASGARRAFRRILRNGAFWGGAETRDGYPPSDYVA